LVVGARWRACLTATRLVRSRKARFSKTSKTAQIGHITVYARTGWNIGVSLCTAEVRGSNPLGSALKISCFVGKYAVVEEVSISRGPFDTSLTPI
jgi:hypothetical protein